MKTIIVNEPIGIYRPHYKPNWLRLAVCVAASLSLYGIGYVIYKLAVYAGLTLAAALRMGGM